MTDEHPARRVTLQRHILESQRRHQEATGELSVLLTQIAYAGKIFAHALGRAALVGRLGPTGGTNVQGEVTKKLDVFGNETIIDAFATSELVAAVVSEEDDEPRQMACGPGAKYVLCVNPLDGSSNSDINGVVGTIFGIYKPRPRRRTRTRSGTPARWWPTCTGPCSKGGSISIPAICAIRMASSVCSTSVRRWRSSWSKRVVQHRPVARVCSTCRSTRSTSGSPSPSGAGSRWRASTSS